MKTTRRNLLGSGLALGCSAAASPILTPVTLAAAPGDNRLVVIILRGAMDGLDVIRPIGDRDIAALRPGWDLQDSLELDNFYGLHPALSDLHPLWRAGEMAAVHAVSTPYRDKRSHFDGQDLLENGSGAADGQLTAGRDGWLNRVVARLPGAHSETAFAVGRENLLLLSGDAATSTWSPDSDLDLSPQARLLLEKVYERDPLFHAAAMQAIELSELTEPGAGMSARRAGRADALAAFAAGRLREDTRIAAFSINGWDTHVNQANALPRALAQLQTAILTLRRDLGSVWDKTAVLCLTEFGRTVRINGSGGTDHGTGGAAIFAGGALRGGSVLGQWPGLSGPDLYQDRDLMPVSAVRAYAAWALRDLFGVGLSDLESVVFPGLDVGQNPGLIA